MTLRRLFVLGAGRAGRGLAAALSTAGVPVTLHGRRAEPDANPAITAGPVAPMLANVDVALIAVRDSQIDGAVQELLAASPPERLVILQASGGIEPGAYREARDRGHPCGTFHPLLPLADEHEAARLFRGAWVGIDGDSAARAWSERLAVALGAQTLEIPANRALYHAGAVLASNFLGVLSALGAKAMHEAGVDSDAAPAATHTLTMAAAENLRTGDPGRVITGPIARGDVATVRAHLEALSPHPGLSEVYRVLSRHAIDLARARGVPNDALAQIERLVDDGVSGSAAAEPPP